MLDILVVLAIIFVWVAGFRATGMGDDLRKFFAHWSGNGKRMIPASEVGTAEMRWWLRDDRTGQLPRWDVQHPWCISHPWADASPTAGAIARLRRDFFNEWPDPFEPIDAARFERLLSALLDDKERYDAERRAERQEISQEVRRAVCEQPGAAHARHNVLARELLKLRGPAAALTVYNSAVKRDAIRWAGALAHVLSDHPDIVRIETAGGMPVFFQHDQVAMIAEMRRKEAKYERLAGGYNKRPSGIDAKASEVQSGWRKSEL